MFVARKIEETYLMRTDKKREECKLPQVRQFTFFSLHFCLFNGFRKDLLVPILRLDNT